MRRAERRARREWAKARFRQWAMTVLRDQRRQGIADGDAQRGQQTTGKRRAEGEPSYREARPYKQRATPEEMQRKRLVPKRTRLVSTAQSTELGKRLTREHGRGRAKMQGTQRRRIAPPPSKNPSSEVLQRPRRCWLQLAGFLLTPYSLLLILRGPDRDPSYHPVVHPL